MRTHTLRHTANLYLSSNRGSYREKKYRRYVILKMINDLFVTGTVPPHWKAINSTHIQLLVNHWHKQKIKPELTWNRADFRLKCAFIVIMVVGPFLLSSDLNSNTMTGLRNEFFDLSSILDPFVNDVTVRSSGVDTKTRTVFIFSSFFFVFLSCAYNSYLYLPYKYHFKGKENSYSQLQKYNKD